MENLNKKFEPWCQTYSGRRFSPITPKAQDVNIFDIAQSLSNQCRFMGHTKAFYSVAQHSVLVSRNCDPQDALWGLLHDATEAYVSDMPKPLKQDPMLAQYCAVEDSLTHVIKDVFELPALPEGKHMPDSVKVADTRMLFTEKRDLLVQIDWGWEIEPYDFKIDPLPPLEARDLFMQRYIELVYSEKGENWGKFIRSTMRHYKDSIQAATWAERQADLGNRR